MDKIGYAPVFLGKIGHSVVLVIVFSRAGGFGEAFARISSRSVVSLDKNGHKSEQKRVVVHGGQNWTLPKLCRYNRAYPGVLRPKSGIILLLNPLLKHSRSPAIHV